MSPIRIKLASYCSYQERCTSEVKKKLVSFELPSEKEEAIIEWLKEERYLDDQRYAVEYANGKFRLKGWGKVKIKFELKKKAINTTLINKALETITDDDYLSRLEGIVEKKELQLSKYSGLVKKQKLITYLQGRGYEWEFIQKVIHKSESTLE
ncbi:MAG: regulatory protein RecX [Cyclobacteriaceae bacterium]